MSDDRELPFIFPAVCRKKITAAFDGGRRPVAMTLRPGKTPSGKEIRGWMRRLLRRIRRHWPKTRITLRGDGHYGRREVMDFCENNGLDYVFGLPGFMRLTTSACLLSST